MKISRIVLRRPLKVPRSNGAMMASEYRDRKLLSPAGGRGVGEGGRNRRACGYLLYSVGVDIRLP